MVIAIEKFNFSNNEWKTLCTHAIANNWHWYESKCVMS